MVISIRHQTENTIHNFYVKDTHRLTSKEVKAICTEMNVKAIFVKGRYYETE